MSDNSTLRAPAARPLYFWRALFVVAMFATAALAVWTKERGVGVMLLVWPMLFLVPMMREAQRTTVAKGEASPATARYNRRTTGAMFAYLVCLVAIGFAPREVAVGWNLMWLVATLPAVPILAVIWAMGRYLAEETDEYLRHLATMAALIGTAAILVVATVIGFLDTFGVIPHVAAWWVVPLFVVVRDIGRAWLKALGR